MQPQRIIEEVVFEGEMGLMTAAELWNMPEDRWRGIRNLITDGVYIAHCLACGHPVYINNRDYGGQKLPFFSHFSGGDPNCVWHTGKNLSPDQARAAQYQGNQESIAHRQLCEKVGEIVALDSRSKIVTVEQYLPPTENDHGSYPDVYVEWEGYGRFAIEFQLSNTFETEISKRCRRYRREGMPLLWLLHGGNLEGSVSSSFRDVIWRHRNNAFVLDNAASVESYKQRTLVLSCYLRNEDGSFDDPKLVRFDELEVPSSWLPFHEDKLIAPQKRKFDERRRPWFTAFLPPGWNKDDVFDPVVQAALASLQWRASDDYTTVRLIAAAFSIVATANGKSCNYASRHPNVRGMLDTFLYWGHFAPFARLLTLLIENTTASDILTRKLAAKMRDARETPQADEESPEWKILRHLLPEALDTRVREEFRYFGELPDWAA